MILANITIPMVGVADVAVMGRLPDPSYIAAITLGATMFSSVYWLFGFLRMGTTGLSAQAFGAGDIHEIARIAARAAIVALTLGVAIIVLQWPLEAALFELFDASAGVSELARRYFSIRIYGAPGLLIYLVALGVLFGLQRMRETLYLSIGLNITNLLLDVLLVLVFDLGVAGVAWGTLVSEWGAAAGGVMLVIRALRIQGYGGRIATSTLWQRAATFQLFHLSSNLVLRTLFVQLPFFAGTVAATHLSDMTLAVHGVLMQLFFVMTYAIDGFAHTAETLAGHAYGARDDKALRHTTRYSSLWGLALALVMALLYWLGGVDIIAQLSVSETLRDEASRYLPWLVLAPLVCVWAFIFDGIFIGTTRIVEMRNAMMLAAAVWGLTLAATFHSLGYHGVWLSMTVFMVVRSAALGWYYPRIARSMRAGAG